MSAPAAWEMGPKRAQNACQRYVQPPFWSCQHTQPWVSAHLCRPSLTTYAHLSKRFRHTHWSPKKLTYQNEKYGHMECVYPANHILLQASQAPNVSDVPIHRQDDRCPLHSVNTRVPGHSNVLVLIIATRSPSLTRDLRASSNQQGLEHHPPCVCPALEQPPKSLSDAKEE